MNSINWKLKDEFDLIEKVDIYLDTIKENLVDADVEDLRKHVHRIEEYTTDLQAS